MRLVNIVCCGMEAMLCIPRTVHFPHSWNASFVHGTVLERMTERRQIDDTCGVENDPRER